MRRANTPQEEQHVADESNKPGSDGKDGENRNFKAGIAVGVGSAALVAALLYARSGKAKKK